MWMKTTPTPVVIIIAIAGALVIWGLLKITPGVRKPPPDLRIWRQDEIERHDRYLPKYFLGAVFALLLGGLQMVVKNYPPLYRWLYQAGYGGHMFRDLANTHIVIVGGGTLLLTAAVWYTLPRVVQRPLYSDSLAHLAFWFTLVGVFGFYITLSWLGLVEGALVRHGWNWIAARDHIGVYQVIPLSVTATLMGIGYWCFVGNVFLTLRAARLVVVPKPEGHLARFFFVGATGLLIGTVQGVIQVQPSNVNWLHRVGAAGDFIDPISHAHVNLVMGVCSLVAGISFYLLPRLVPGARADRAQEKRVFWLLTIGSTWFYVTFLAMGLIEGNIEVNTHRNYYQVATMLGPLHAVPMAVAGVLMVTGFWYFLYTLLRRVLPAVRQNIPATFYAAGIAALFIGTFQGPLQAFSPIQLWMARAGDAGDAIGQSHALLNITAGVMVILMGMALMLAPEILRRPVPRRQALGALAGVWGGTFLTYLATMPFSIIEGSRLQQGGTFLRVAAPFLPTEPLVLMLGGALVLAGFSLFAYCMYEETVRYRQRAYLLASDLPEQYTGPVNPRVRYRGLAPALVLEFGGAIVGFPGAGWLYTGRAFQGTLLLLLFPGIPWAIIPGVFTPYGGFLAHWGLATLLVYLPVSAVLSTSILGYVHYQELKSGTTRRRMRRRHWSMTDLGIPPQREEKAAPPPVRMPGD